MKTIILAMMIALFLSLDARPAEAPKPTLEQCQQSMASLTQYVIFLRGQRDSLEEQLAVLQQKVNALAPKEAPKAPVKK